MLDKGLQPHHQHLFGQRRKRPVRPDQLLGGQGRHARLHDGAGAGSGQQGRDGEHREPGLHRHRHGQAIRQDVLDKIVAGIPVKRLGTPGEIASIVGWLAGEESGFTTGAGLLPQRWLVWVTAGREIVRGRSLTARMLAQGLGEPGSEGHVAPGRWFSASVRLSASAPRIDIAMRLGLDHRQRGDQDGAVDVHLHPAGAPAEALLQHQHQDVQPARGWRGGETARGSPKPKQPAGHGGETRGR